jgi:hypothetical protein
MRFTRRLAALEARADHLLSFVELTPIYVRGGVPLDKDPYRASRLQIIPGFRVYGGLPRVEPEVYGETIDEDALA